MSKSKYHYLHEEKPRDVNEEEKNLKVYSIEVNGFEIIAILFLVYELLKFLQ